MINFIIYALQNSYQKIHYNQFWQLIIYVRWNVKKQNSLSHEIILQLIQF